MARHSIPVFVAGLLVSSSPVAHSAAAFRWFLAPGMNGTIIAGVENKEGSFLRLSCTSGEPPGPSLEVDVKKIQLKDKDSVQIVVDGNAYFFAMKEFGGSYLADLDTRTARLQLTQLAHALMKSRSQKFSIEFPRLNQSQSFSLLDARKSLKETDTTSIVDDCS